MRAIKWDPSIGIDLGFFTIRWYSLMFVLAFVLGLRIMKKFYKEDGIDEKHLDTVFMYAFVSMLIGMRLGEVFFYSWDYYQNHILEIFIPFKKLANGSWKFVGFAGFASHGAAIAIPIALYFYAKKHIKKSWLFILDRVAVTVALAGFFIRFGNFCNSEIYGKPTGSDFGVIFVADLFGIFMIVLWSLRFFIEFLKEAQVEGREDWVFNSLNTGQVLSIPLVLLGFWLVFRKQKIVN